MSASKEQIMKMVEAIRQAGLELPAELREELNNLQNPVYNLAFVGRFQVGKTTAINRVVLKSEVLLKEGIGLCTTAVATKVQYGEKPQLTVIPWVKRTETMTQDGQSVQVETKDGPGTPVTIDNPTKEEIARYTTANTEAERLVLAENTYSVELTWPAESLKKYILIDTPGVDDTNTALLDATTYRIVPSADVAILVVGASSMTEHERNFLRSRILDAGISRMMILVSYQADKDRKSPEVRGQILDQIRADLRLIGRENIPVRMFCYDPKVQGDILNTPESIEKAIVEFADANAAAGRIEKLHYLLQRQLVLHATTLSAQIAMVGKSVADRKALREKFDAAAIDLRQKYDTLSDRFSMDTRRLQRKAGDRLTNACETIGDDYIKGFEDCNTLTEAHGRLSNAENLMKRPFEDAITNVCQEIREEIARILQGYNAELAKAADGIRTVMQVDMHVNGGWLAKFNPNLVVLADYALSLFVLPGSIVSDVIIRFLAGKIPFIKKFVPANIIKNMMVSTISKSVKQQIAEIGDNLRVQLGETFERVEQSIKQEFASLYLKEVQPMQEAVERAEAQETNVDVAGLTAKRDAIATLIENT
ncbi:MAG: dynamin family protein [Phycisphaerales bacterium]|nr:dynamin family protein [Phycisphaerales bacterium]